MVLGERGVTQKVGKNTEGAQRREVLRVLVVFRVQGEVRVQEGAQSMKNETQSIEWAQHRGVELPGASAQGLDSSEDTEGLRAQGTYRTVSVGEASGHRATEEGSEYGRVKVQGC